MAENEATGKSRPSKILLEELYANQDDQFLDQLVQFDSYEFLKHFSRKWIDDPRPWARQQLIHYLRSKLNYPGHEVVLKRTFKTALDNADDELLVQFMVALDGLVRRQRSTMHLYDYRTRQYSQREYLLAKPNKTVREETGRFHEYTYSRRTIRVPLPDVRNRSSNRLFSQKTRAHLRRRVWRYFRFMAYRDPQRYVSAITAALESYDDSFFDSGEAILDNWSLMHACYFHAPEIAFTVSHTNVVRGQSLATLKAAPYLPQVWEGDANAKNLWDLLGGAKSQFVRIWTIEMLQAQHADWLANVSIDDLIQLLSSGSATVGEFAVELFRQHKSLSKVDVPTWLRLLEEADFSVLPIICEVMQKNIDPVRLSDDQLVELTLARPASIARLGLGWLRTRHEQHPLSTTQLRRLATAECRWEAEVIADWAIAQLAQPERYSAEHLAEFFDSKQDPVRHAACRWLGSASVEADRPTPQHDPHLWLKLVETPYDAVRFSLLDLLGRFLDASPDEMDKTLSPDQYLRVLSAVVLCVNRGSRSKPKAIQQLASLAIRDPSQADVVVPVLAVAARSIREPEKAAGLSGLATIIDRHPQLAELMGDVIGEWSWQDNGTHPEATS